MQIKFKVILFEILITNIIRAGCVVCPDGYIEDGVSCAECGITNMNRNVKIVGGIEANKNSWPSQALIIQFYQGDYIVNGSLITLSEAWMCGGTLINGHTVLSAAHCIVTNFDKTINGVTYNFAIYHTNNKYNPTNHSMFKVILGAHDISFLAILSMPQLPAVIFSVSDVIIHPNYDSSTMLNDISLYILSDRVIFNSYIKPACLPPTFSLSYPIHTNKSYTSGWGSNSSGGVASHVLMNVNLTIYANTQCKNIIPTKTKSAYAQICAGELVGSKDTCEGDSGGGLYILDKLSMQDRFVVSGITSYGDGCGSGKPSIYTRVSYYRDWIIKFMKVPSNFTSIPSKSSNNSKFKTILLYNQILLVILCMIISKLVLSGS